jgi:polar amino acid transport system ATP-binding protein
MATSETDGTMPEDDRPGDGGATDTAGDAVPADAPVGVAASGDGTEPIVRMQKVVKRFGDNVVLDQLDLDVAPAEKLVIIGPSGSGKTTILRVIMTLERPQDGHVIIDGQHLYHEERNGSLKPARERHIREVRSEVSMVFQHFNLFPHKTVGENITLAPRKVLGLDKDEAQKRARDLLDQVGLADKIDQHPAELSGGQKQRAAIARALAMRPKIMLFDEVTSALDPELVGDVLNVLRDLVEHTEMTMLLVTHEMGFAQEIADRVVMFDGGRIIEQAPPAEMFGAPQEERTKAFLHAVLHPGD